MKTGKKVVSRKFNGKTQDFKDKQEENFEKKHLKAYLKGVQKFRIGQDEKGYGIYVPVNYELIYEE